jgi:phosphonopyruvate decarboxylase
MMIAPIALLEAFRSQGIDYFTGVPDTVLRNFCACVADEVPEGNHVIAANEGNAVALAAGRYLGSGQPALVYMQNSGIGNSVNPLVSLADKEVYSIPMLLLVGWRGAPGFKDEPQHVKQGRIMTGLLGALEIPYFVLDGGEEDPKGVVDKACVAMHDRSAPVAILVKPGAIGPYVTLAEPPPRDAPLSREGAIKLVVDSLGPNDVVVSTTGKTSRELYEYRRSRGEPDGLDFMTVGSMGHASSIAMGLASARPERTVVCLDGDGAALMHLGSMAIIGQSRLENLIHVVINNGSHDSVGGQPTVAFSVSLTHVAEACGYREALSVSRSDEVAKVARELRGGPGPLFLEIRVDRGARDDLGRPGTSPLQNRDAFMIRLGAKGGDR